MTPRAPALSRDERRASIIEATIPLLRAHGREVTTKQIAEAAGIAEGTIFRVFETKDELVEAAIAEALGMEGYLVRMRALEPNGTLEERLVRIATVMHERFTAVFSLLSALGMMAPPEYVKHEGHGQSELRRQVTEVTLAALGDPGDELRVSPERALAHLRMLVFVGAHHRMSAGNPLSPREAVDLLLNGIRKER